MTKKIIASISIFAILVISVVLFLKSKSNKEYNELFSQTFEQINMQAGLCQITCESFLSVWTYAIETKQDPILLIKNFLDLDSVHKRIDDCENEKNSIVEKMNLLKDYPDEYKEKYNEIVKLYLLYFEIYRNSTYPSGNLMEYKAKIPANMDKFLGQVERIKLISQ